MGVKGAGQRSPSRAAARAAAPCPKASGWWEAGGDGCGFERGGQHTAGPARAGGRGEPAETPVQRGEPRLLLIVVARWSTRSEVLNEPVAPRELAPESPGRRLLQLAALFLRLGLTTFGGPAAHIAMMENEVVRRRQWLSPERFLDLLGVANLIPGPSSSELAIFIGLDRAGWPGWILAGLCFILPASVLTGGIAWAYVQFGTLPHVAGLLYGVKPVIIAVVVQALVRLAPKALRSRVLAAVAILSAALFALGFDALWTLGGAGVLTLLVALRPRRTSPPSTAAGVLALPQVLPALAVTAAGAPAGLLAIFLKFLKFGAVVFGSGYVLVAFLRTELVDRAHWLTEAQLLDAVAVGQVTPGPVFTTATFIGYLLAGFPGAALATIGIFLPGFLLVAAIRPAIDRVRASPGAAAFLDGVSAASWALMAVAALQLASAGLIDVPTVAIGALSAIALLWLGASPTLLIGLGGLAGALLRGLS